LRAHKESGRGDWIWERGSAILLVGLVLWLEIHLAALPSLSRTSLTLWFEYPLNLGAAIAFIVIGALHAGLGLRSIVIDYVSTRASRFLMLLLIRLLLVVSAIVGLGSLWVLRTGMSS
jgi:succinate dehydrogenase / fumarate reductase, membrane anchor subunit